MIDAYRTAAKMAIEEGIIIEKQVCDYYKIDFSYNKMSEVMKVLKDLDLPQSDQNFDLNCSLKTSVRISESNLLIEQLEGEEVKFTHLFRR